MKRGMLKLLLNNFPGIVIIDEAYINFSPGKKHLYRTYRISEPDSDANTFKSLGTGFVAAGTGFCFVGYY